MFKKLCAAASAVVFASTLITPAFADSIENATAKKQAQIPICTHKIGTVAIYEPKNDWWTPLQLGSPEALIKVLVMQSGCFTLLDRGNGFDVAQQERALASSGMLRRGSNIGRGQIKAADYVLVPDIVSKNNDSGGSAIFGILGALIPGIGGAIVGGLKLNSKTADVVLTITDVRSSEQKAMEQGHGKKTDLSFGGGGGIIGGGAFAAAGAGTYENTDIGQVVALAYIDAYTKLVGDLGGLPTDASAANVPQSVTMTKPGHLFATPSVKGKVVRSLSVGDTLYPTGTQSGLWWQVKDEIGNLGWVSSLLVQLAK